MLPPRAPLLTAGAAATLAWLASARSLRQPALRTAFSLLAASHALDLGLFIRIAFIDGAARLRWRKSATGVLEAQRVRYRCWPHEIDFNNHMSNANFLRVLNYARRSFWRENGMWDHCLSRSPPLNMVVNASTIRYRREISALQPYEIVTSLVYWEGPCLYLEAKFVDAATGFVLAISLVKYRLVGRRGCSPPSAAEVLAEHDPNSVGDGRAPPEPPAELRAWMDYSRLSSAALRPS